MFKFGAAGGCVVLSPVGGAFVEVGENKGPLRGRPPLLNASFFPVRAALTASLEGEVECAARI